MTLALNPAIARLRCSRSGLDAPTGGFVRPLGLCGCCPPPGAPLVFEYDPAAARKELAERLHGQGLWRWAPLLPVDGVPDGYGEDVGGTASVSSPRLSVEHGVEVLLKVEASNPSGSFKDRGLAVAVALGAACGARRFCLPTQGNAGVAACLFSARLGLPGCLVWMPESFAGSIYHRACEHFGGSVRFFGPNIAAAGRAMREELGGQLASGEIVDVSTFFEPGRLEGKKTMGLEIAEAAGVFAGATRPELPDWILYPTGGGTGLVGIWKAFAELRALGLIADGVRLPRMGAVQSERCAPVVEAFARGDAAVSPVTSQGTVADGLDVPGAIMGHGILAAVRESCGTAHAVSEDGIRAAFARLGALGVAAGYEAAATLAALADLRASGVIAAGARVLLLLTGGHQVALSRAS